MDDLKRSTTRIVPTSASSQHWLTLMTCIICSNTPDISPVYKCSMGHTVCDPCFQRVVNNGTPICNECESEEFIRVEVSSDFLRKLKSKPGIGRPYRYRKDQCHVNSARLNSAEASSISLDNLLGNQLRSPNRYTLARHIDEATSSMCNLTTEEADNEGSVQSLTSSKVWLQKAKDEYKLNLDGNWSRSHKPLKCPHHPCNKTIAVSSFLSHFKYEHSDFRRFLLERGKELALDFNPMIVKHETSLCLGIIQLSDTNQEIETFWLMVSGSPADRKGQSFALFYLFAKNDDLYRCTMELCSKHDLTTVTTFCGVNAIYESQHISDIAVRHNCLYAYHGTIEAMLDYGPILKFRIIIH